MISGRVKCLMVAVFSLFFTGILSPLAAQEKHDEHTVKTEEGKEKIDPAKSIMEHIKDAHQFHFFTLGNFKAVIPLPVILYSPQKGWSGFMSSRFEEGASEVDGYRLVDEKVVPVDPAVKVYDLSLTRNVVQMLLALIILVLLMTSIARKYKSGQGVTSSPKGWQGAIEPVITFVRDDVAKPNLGHHYHKYLPYLLTIFFFILINNILGLIPGSANVTGNIAFTMVLAVISLLVILFSSNRHFWGHILWPPGVPFVIKFILVPVEFAGIFIKPIALMIRLFANMVAGHIIILSFVSLIFIFGAMSKIAGWGFSPFSILFTVFIYFIEILVAFIQAYIFVNLTAVFIGQAFETSHHDGNGQDDPVII